MSHFRTPTVVVEIEDGSDLRYPGYAMERARIALEAEGFTGVRVRNAPNETGELPPSDFGNGAA
jgi:hypothetical protein